MMEFASVKKRQDEAVRREADGRADEGCGDVLLVIQVRR
jgi:hypothetical protein